MERCSQCRFMATESQFVVLRGKFPLHLYGTAEAMCSKFKQVIELGVKPVLTIICYRMLCDLESDNKTQTTPSIYCRERAVA